jgi:hypothetical protein
MGYGPKHTNQNNYLNMKNHPRKAINHLIMMMEKGVIPAEVIAKACFNYMSESDVLDMACNEGFIEDSEDFE